MSTIRPGVIGLGNMGAVHVRSLQQGNAPALAVRRAVAETRRRLPGESTR